MLLEAGEIIRATLAHDAPSVNGRVFLPEDEDPELFGEAAIRVELAHYIAKEVFADGIHFEVAFEETWVVWVLVKSYSRAERIKEAMQVAAPILREVMAALVGRSFATESGDTFWLTPLTGAEMLPGYSASHASFPLAFRAESALSGMSEGRP